MQNVSSPLKLAPDLITRALVDGSMTAWAQSDVDGVLALVSPDVTHTLNVDGDRVPFARSVVGREALGAKLRDVIDMFEIGAYVMDHLLISGHKARARMRIVYIHRNTRERLVTKFRYVFEQRDGCISKIDEFHDASYLEAFMRLVSRSSTR